MLHLLQIYGSASRQLYIIYPSYPRGISTQSILYPSYPRGISKLLYWMFLLY